MSETIVPYGRFLEVRQRRERVVAELARQVSDKECGTRAPATPGGAADGGGREYRQSRAAEARCGVPGAVPDRDAG
jgi:hypothetical protein